MKVSNVRVQSPRVRPLHVAAAATLTNDILRPTCFYGIGGVGLALAATESLIAGCFQMYISRNKEALEKRVQKVDIQSTEVTEMTRRNGFAGGILRAAAGIGTFIVGGAASRLVELSLIPVKRAMCIAWSMLLVGQTAVLVPVINGDWAQKAKDMVRARASVYGTIALFTLYGAFKPEQGD